VRLDICKFKVDAVTNHEVFFFLSLNQLNFIKNQIRAQDEHKLDKKYKQKVPYISETLENKTPTKTPMRSAPIKTTPTKIINPTKIM